ncbi:hypothetical protein [Caldimonas sp. KR1-144]|uniref:hypothetical protein n=1 Tax=Caldimonas sp. KR1-144 TaxID=3400911 RepID=UPI003C0CCCCE
MSSTHRHTQGTRFEIRYPSLFSEGRGYAFPCDKHGRVDMDRLSEAGRRNFLFARAMVGREFATPVVHAA